jgi:ABC-type nickel/cobalt efflux system permease component RcnA
MYRIKLLIGILVAAFSVVYLLFGIVGWVNESMKAADLMTCLILASLHLGIGSWLLFTSLREYRQEHRRVEDVVRHLIESSGGRVTIVDVAKYAGISEDDAREHLERRSKHDVVIIMQNTAGSDVFFFGQQYWNN